MSQSFFASFFSKKEDSFLWFVPAAILVFACTWMGQTGAPVWLRYVGIPFGLLAACVLFAPRLRGVAAAAREAAPALPWLIGFFVLVGSGGMVNHGAIFAAMSFDFWHADVLVAPDRRPVLPAIAALLPPWPAPYAVVWYGSFSALFLAAWRFLAMQGMAPLPRFSVLTSSIVAYLLIIPGYTEGLAFLLALLCRGARLRAAEKGVAAAVMMGAHEVAGAFCLAFLAIEAEGRERRDWIGVGLFLFLVYAAGYGLSAGSGLLADLARATHAAALHPLSAWQLDLAHPGRCGLGLLASYKLFWLLVPAGLAQGGRARAHAVCVLLALPLVLVAVDTSRIVQFGSLSLLAIAVSRPPSLWLAVANLLLPSLCVGTLAMPAWGKGLYAAYLLAGQRLGVSFGGMAF